MNSVEKDFFIRMEKERTRQHEKWGDRVDLNTANDWVAHLTRYVGLAVTTPFDKAVFQRAMVQVATLCLAAFESSQRDLAPRHYDQPAEGITNEDDFFSRVEDHENEEPEPGSRVELDVPWPDGIKRMTGTLVLVQGGEAFVETEFGPVSGDPTTIEVLEGPGG